MHLQLFLLLFWLSFRISPTKPTATDCDPIPVCCNFYFQRIPKDQDNESAILGFKNESEIGRQRHWEGVVPQHYYLELNFFNRTHYNGSVDITFKLVQPTNRIMINHDIQYPSIDYSQINIRPQCGHDAGRNRTGVVRTNCIEKATFSESERTVVLDLKQANLKVNSTYVISFPSFHGRSADKNGKNGAEGLREASDVRAIASTTIFQMRYARTVFPCFDHPALKASFELCVQHTEDILVASNTLRLYLGYRGNRTLLSCFARTPVMSTYLFTFALMENYTSESVQVPDGPEIEVFSPVDTMEKLRWMLNATIPVVQYMEKITNFKFPLKRLAFVAAYPAPFAGVENFGLVTVNGPRLHEYGGIADAVLYHEIVHQWLGNVVTIEDWREICLQEGLTAYFDWKITAECRGESLDAKAEDIRRSIEGYYEPYALRNYAVTEDIANNCFDRPPFFFHAITKKEGFETLEKFLAKLIKKRPFGNADIELWDQTMDEVSKGGEHALKGYLKGWFLQPGPLYLFASRVQGSDCILLRQKMYGPGDGSEPPTAPRPVPLIVKTYGPSTKSKSVILRSLEQKVCDIGGVVFLVDPELSTFTRRAYTAENYRRLLQLEEQTPTALTHTQLTNLVMDFCDALIDNVLPLADEPAATEASDWLEVYQSIRNSSVTLYDSCKVCLNSKEENEVLFIFKRIWNELCRDLRLTQVVGRNYTIEFNTSYPIADS